MSRSVGIVVPAFQPDVERLEGYVRTLEERLEPAAIRIELDDPDPSTVERLETTPATVHAVDRRRGKGAAITAGFCALDTDVLGFVDADGSTPAESVADIVDAVRAERAELAVGSRRHPESDVRSVQSFKRRFLGGAFAWLAQRLLSVSVSDYQCGAKAIDAAVWTEVSPHLCESGFAWDADLIAFVDALGYRLEEVPITWEDAASSTVSSIGTSTELAAGLFRTRHRVKQFRGDRLHTAIATRRSNPEPIVDSVGIERYDE